MPEPMTERPESTEPTESPEPSQTGMVRLRDAFVRPGRGQFVVALLLAVLAFAAVTQVRSHTGNDSYSGMRQDDLVQALNGLSANTTRSEAEIADLEATRSELRDSTRQRAAALEQSQKELATLGILAGTRAATGPGITITVAVNASRYRANNLLDGIEELRDAGAEAMQINDEVRIIAQTSFQDGDNGIVVDGRELTPPYTLKVIGDPDTLATALNISGGFRDDVELAQGKTDVVKSKAISVDVTRVATAPRYAESTEPVG